MMADDTRSGSRSDDEGQDHLNSAYSTPGSGFATPQPDPIDKRLPGIKHGYLGQVGVRSTSVRDFPAPVVPMPERGPSYGGFFLHERRDDDDDDEEELDFAAAAFGALSMLPTAPSSPLRKSSEDELDGPPLLPHERMDEPKRDDRAAPPAMAPWCPTPPLSSRSSLLYEGGVGGGGGGGGGSGGEGMLAPRGSLAFASARPAEDDGAPGPVVSLRTRRRTMGLSNPLSGILTMSTAHATFVSSPTTIPHASTAPTTPFFANPFAATGALPAPSASYFELKRLTEGPLAAAAAREKNTPPHTPRTSSSNQDGAPAPAPASGRPPTSNPLARTAQEHLSARRNGSGETTGLATNGAAPTSMTAATKGASVGAPKGKLLIGISQARGLRPSRDPYVVCVCDWNEYISRGPRAAELDRDRAGARIPNGGLDIRRVANDTGRAVAIPMKSRQSSTTSLSEKKDAKDVKTITDPRWDHEAIFDVRGEHSELDISVYDRSGPEETFLGHVRWSTRLDEKAGVTDRWFQLEPRGAGEAPVTGEIHLHIKFQKTDKKHYGPEDFKILKLIGKGTFGQVYQVRKKDTQRIYAMKVLSKKVIVQKKEVAHTVGERNILVRTATTDSPFIVGLKFSFQTPTDLYLVTDFMSGGELFWHLQREGRFNEQRAKFYIAELILALQHLHQHDIVYRDLKPENILLDANGHVALCDFGLSKANLTKNDTTNTFCGTTEYLAPEVLLDDQGYTKMVDFWSLGVLVFEMCCGWSPFYAEDTQQMYKNIAFGKVRFPRDALSTEGRNFVKGLLNRNPKHRLGATDDAEELKRHAFFGDVDWEALMRKNVVPPFKPKLKSVLDTSNFDPEFTNALNGASSLNNRAAALASGAVPASTPLSPGVQANFKGFTFVDESTMDEAFHGRDRDDLERMDEDDREDERSWDEDDVDGAAAAMDGSSGATNRMSGIVRTGAGGGDDGVFNDGNFDI